VTEHQAAPSALNRAVAGLLRLASSDMKDAELLLAGRNPENAPLLLNIGVGRMLEAIVATEHGWPIKDKSCDLRHIPNENQATIQARRRRGRHGQTSLRG
jgi:hypothetical protein